MTFFGAPETAASNLRGSIEPSSRTTALDQIGLIVIITILELDRKDPLNWHPAGAMGHATRLFCLMSCQWLHRGWTVLMHPSMPKLTENWGLVQFSKSSLGNWTRSLAGACSPVAPLWQTWGCLISWQILEIAEKCLFFVQKVSSLPELNIPVVHSGAALVFAGCWNWQCCRSGFLLKQGRLATKRFLPTQREFTRYRDF